MPPQKTLAEKVTEFRQDLDQITQLLEQLKREYDLFFNGARKRPPHEMRVQVERLLRKWRTSNIQKLELTFRLNTLHSKYASMSDVWERILKRREKDPRAITPFGPTASEIAASMADNRERQEAARERRSEQPSSDGGMQRLFNDFVDAKRELGESSSMSFEKFQAQLEKQKEAIRGRTQAKDVQFSVTRKDGKVSLTAKPIRD